VAQVPVHTAPDSARTQSRLYLHRAGSGRWDLPVRRPVPQPGSRSLGSCSGYLGRCTAWDRTCRCSQQSVHEAADTSEGSFWLSAIATVGWGCDLHITRAVQPALPPPSHSSSGHWNTAHTHSPALSRPTRDSSSFPWNYPFNKHCSLGPSRCGAQCYTQNLEGSEALNKAHSGSRGSPALPCSR